MNKLTGIFHTLIVATVVMFVASPTIVLADISTKPNVGDSSKVKGQSDATKFEVQESGEVLLSVILNIYSWQKRESTYRVPVLCVFRKNLINFNFVNPSPI